MKSNTKRRWIYVVSALLILCCVLMLFQPDPVHLKLIISPPDMDGSVAEFVVNIPENCQIKRVFLRGNGNVPRDGRLMTLIINGEKFSIDNFGQLVAVKDNSEPGFEDRQLDLDWKNLKNTRTWIISYENLDPAVKRYDLELVLELIGDNDKLKNWNSFFNVRRRHIAPAVSPDAGKDSQEVKVDEAPAAENKKAPAATAPAPGM